MKLLLAAALAAIVLANPVTDADGNVTTTNADGSKTTVPAVPADEI